MFGISVEQPSAFVWPWSIYNTFRQRATVSPRVRTKERNLFFFIFLLSTASFFYHCSSKAKSIVCSASDNVCWIERKSIVVHRCYDQHWLEEKRSNSHDNRRLSTVLDHLIRVRCAIHVQAKRIKASFDLINDCTMRLLHGRETFMLAKSISREYRSGLYEQAVDTQESAHWQWNMEEMTRPLLAVRKSLLNSTRKSSWRTAAIISADNSPKSLV